MKIFNVIFILLFISLILGCIEQTAPENTQIANPASVNCIQNNGTLEIRDEVGGQVGYCKFANGKECEEWAYFRGECLLK